MMGKLRSGIILSVFLGTVFAGDLPAQKTDKSAGDIKPPAGWKGRVEIKDGVRTVVNPDQPLYGEFAFELEKDLVIGDENDEHKTFYQGAAIQVDAQGCIYVLDNEKQCILKFDPSGRYLMTIGRKGQGPGEFEQPLAFFIDGQGRILVGHSDYRTIEVFKPDGSPEKRISGAIRHLNFCMSPDGGVFANIFRFIPEGQKAYNDVVRVGPQGNLVRTIATYDAHPLLFFMNGDLIGHGYKHHFSDDLIFLPLCEGGFCYGNPSAYQIVFMNADGLVHHAVEKHEKPAGITAKEKADYINYFAGLDKKRSEQAGGAAFERKPFFPDHKPFYTEFLRDERSRLYVGRFSAFRGDADPSIKTESGDYDVFDKNGIFIYRMKIPLGEGSVINRGFVYGVENDKEAGSYRIVRYRIKNYDKMKGGG